MSALRFDNVTIRLGRRDILAATSFDISEREFVGVLGANGSGKTTLMRAALGLVPLAAGTVSVLGKPAARGNPPRDRPHAAGARGGRGLEVLRLGRRRERRDRRPLRLRPPRQGDPARDRPGLNLVGARELAHRAIGELSGGERQRMLLAQALIGAPRLLLLDEPLISLDPAHQKAVVEIAQRISDELRIAVLFSAHELNPLVNAIDRVLYLGGGAAVIGRVDEVVTGPVLSRLYGAPIEVVRAKDRYFVMAGGVEVEREAHRHEPSHDHAHV